MKIAIGCGVALLLLLVLMFACFGMAARFAGKKAEDFSAAMEDQEKAGETAAELEREYAFTPPADGTLDEKLVDRFFAVTDDAWDEMEDWVGEMAERGERIDERDSRAGFGDAVAGMRGMGRSRVALVQALEEHDMAPSAYVWTGFTLMRAHEAAQSAGGQAAGLPEKNLEIARQHADQIAELEKDEGKESKGTVLGMALLFFPRADVFVPGGIDTSFGGGR